MSEHICHASACTNPVPPAKFMCYHHWKMLPKPMQNAIWGAYVPGQEIRKDPSVRYMEIAHHAIDYVKDIEKSKARAAVLKTGSINRLRGEQ